MLPAAALVEVRRSHGVLKFCYFMLLAASQSYTSKSIARREVRDRSYPSIRPPRPSPSLIPHQPAPQVPSASSSFSSSSSFLVLLLLLLLLAPLLHSLPPGRAFVRQVIASEVLQKRERANHESGKRALSGSVWSFIFEGGVTDKIWADVQVGGGSI